MLYKAVLLVALLCCIGALATQQSDCNCEDCDCQVNYKWVSFNVLTNEFYGPNSFIALRSNGNNATGLWGTVEVKKALDGPTISLEYEVFKEINGCYISVLKRCPFQFCAVPDPQDLSYISLTGLLNFTPPVNGCPVKRDQYKLLGVIPSPQQVRDITATGNLLIDYVAKNNGIPFFQVRLSLNIECGN